MKKILILILIFTPLCSLFADGGYCATCESYYSGTSCEVDHDHTCPESSECDIKSSHNGLNLCTCGKPYFKRNCTDCTKCGGCSFSHNDCPDCGVSCGSAHKECSECGKHTGHSLWKW